MGSHLLGYQVSSPVPPPGPQEIPFLFTVIGSKSAAEYLAVPEPAVIAEAESGRLPGQKIGPEWRFVVLALVDWLRAGRPGGTPRAAARDRLLDLPAPDETPEEQEVFLQHMRDLRKSSGTVGGDDERDAG